jgi:hypothetical protein
MRSHKRKRHEGVESSQPGNWTRATTVDPPSEALQAPQGGMTRQLFGAVESPLKAGTSLRRP